MAGPGRPRATIDEFNLDKTVTPPTAPKPRREPTKYTFELVGDFPIDKENGTIRYPPRVLINNECLVWDEKTGTSRMARLLRGIPTIWRDEQDKVLPGYANNNKVEFWIINGKLVVPAIEKQSIQYLMLRNDFQGVKVQARAVKARYKLVDTYTNENKALELRIEQMEAVKLAMETELEDLIPHFKHLGGNMTNSEGEVMSDEGVRAAYMKLAEDKPKLFMKTYDNPIVKMFGYVRNAFEKNLITFVDGQCSWTDTKVFICQVPGEYTNKVADYLAQLMLLPEGLELRSRLENLK